MVQMVLDKFQKQPVGLDSPAEDGFVITPHDVIDLYEYPRAIYIGGAGNIVLITKEGTELKFYGCLAGTIIPIRVRRVLVTSSDSEAVETTATNLIGLV